MSPTRGYHGTNKENALSILKDGIELSFGKPRHDFSHADGFYLNRHKNGAYKFALNKRPSGHSVPTVIYYN